MKDNTGGALVEDIEPLIRTIRGQKVILDADLARLYGVETRAFNRAVKRNAGRFPPDFVFQLTRDEFGNLKYQFGTSSLSHGGRRKLPWAFTENGAVMSANATQAPDWLSCAARCRVARQSESQKAMKSRCRTFQLSDNFAAALANEKKAGLVIGDPEFKGLEKEIRIAWLK